MKRRYGCRVVLAIATLALGSAGTTGCSYITILRSRARIRKTLFVSGRYGPARLDVCDNIPVLHLHGTPEEMGTQYGTLLREPLQALDAYLRAALSDEGLRPLLAFAKAHEQALPAGVRAELRAIAQAADVPYLNLVAINVLPRMACTGLAVSGKASKDGTLVMGRNVDYFGFGLEDRASMIVVYHPREGVPVVAVSFLGFIGAFTGINAEGVAFGNMLVFNAREDGVRRDGVPIQIAMRLAAQRSRSAGEMGSALAAQRPLIPMNVMVADADEAIVLELGLDGAQTRLPKNGILAVSNSFRTPDLRANQVLCERYMALVAAASDHYGTFDAELMQRTLHAARIRTLNLQAAVFEPAAMRLHVSVNRSPASAGPYTAFDVRELCSPE